MPACSRPVRADYSRITWWWGGCFHIAMGLRKTPRPPQFFRRLTLEVTSTLRYTLEFWAVVPILDGIVKPALARNIRNG